MPNKAIIAEVEPALIARELTDERFLRHTNRAGNEIYVVDAHCAPNTMRELGRLREIAFRAAGGGTGLDCDIDRFDTMERPCQQLIVWNPDSHEIVGGYRFLLGQDMAMRPDGAPDIAFSHLFSYSREFIERYLPQCIELGRSFVRLEYQSTRAGARALFALDNLWDGLGALSVKYPQVKHLFGKMTMYPNYSHHGRDLILYFLRHYFGDREGLVSPIRPVSYYGDEAALAACFSGDDFRADHARLSQTVRAEGVSIPPLVNAYMSLSPTMRMFGTAINDEFGDVEESGIMISIADMAAEKVARHIDTYHPDDTI